MIVDFEFRGDIYPIEITGIVPAIGETVTGGFAPSPWICGIDNSTNAPGWDRPFRGKMWLEDGQDFWERANKFTPPKVLAEMNQMYRDEGASMAAASRVSGNDDLQWIQE